MFYIIYKSNNEVKLTYLQESPMVRFFLRFCLVLNFVLSTDFLALRHRLPSVFAIILRAELHLIILLHTDAHIGKI